VRVVKERVSGGGMIWVASQNDTKRYFALLTSNLFGIYSEMDCTHGELVNSIFKKDMAAHNYVLLSHTRRL